MKQFLNEELKRISFLSKYNRGVVISEQVSPSLQYQPQGLPKSDTVTPAPTAAAPVTGAVTPAPAATAAAATSDQIMKVQQKLVDMGYKLGTSGPKKNGVDGKWGPLTAAAFSQAKDLAAAKGDVAKVQADKKAADDLAAQQKAEREKQLADLNTKINAPVQPDVKPVVPPSEPQVQQTPQQIRQDTRAQIQDLRAQKRQDIQQARQNRRQERTLARQARRNERRFGSSNPEPQGDTDVESI